MPAADAPLRIQQSSVELGDPHICSDARNRLSILRTLFDALVARDDHGQFVPALATRWRVRADARTWTFALRPDVLFHNGDRLCAADVVASLQRACDPAIGGELGTEGVFASYLGEATVQALDDQTVRITTPQPLADLLDLLVDIPIAPQQMLADMAGVYVGSGPYRLVAHHPHEVVLEAFAQSWRGTPPYDRVVWRTETDAVRRVANLRAGRVDLIADVPPPDAARLAADSPAAVWRLESNLCVSFLCNAQAGPCRDRRVRRALNYALDVPRLIDAVLHGAATPLNGPLAPLHVGHDPHCSPYPFQPDTARALLDAASPSATLTLTLDVPTTIPDAAPALAHEMAAQYAEVGIHVDVQTFADRPAYAQMVKAKRIHDACCFDSSPLSTYRVLREKFHSGVAGPWWQGYHNAAVNELLDQARATPNDTARRALYRHAYRLLRADAPWIFLYRPTLCWGVRTPAQHASITSEGLIRLHAP